MSDLTVRHCCSRCQEYGSSVSSGSPTGPGWCRWRRPTKRRRRARRVGVVSMSVKARVITSPRDIPYGEDRIVVRWHKTRWRCREDYCERSSFTEAIAQVPARARTTRRLRTQIGAAIGDTARSVAEVATAYDVSWPTAHRAFVAHAEAVLASRTPRRCSASTRPAAESPAGNGARRAGGGCGSTRGTPDSSTWPATRACSASAAPVPGLVHRLADPRVAHPGRHHRRMVARDQRVRADRYHQRAHRGLQPARQTGQTRRLRVPKPRKPARRIRFHCTRKQRAATQTSC